MCEHFPGPKSFGERVKVELYLSNFFPAGSFKKYKIKTNPNMSILVYFKIQNDQPRITQNVLKSAFKMLQIFHLFAKSKFCKK